jgi:hypothetical protein
VAVSAPRFAIAISIVGLLMAACTAGSDDPTAARSQVHLASAAPSAGLPDPKPGDRWRYDVGPTLRVTAVEGQLVTIRRGKSTTIVRPRNPFLPPVASDSRSSEIRSVVDAPPDALFPLAAGNSVEFQEKRRVRRKFGGRVRVSTREWRCVVGELTTVSVPLGSFEAWPVQCDNPAADALFRIDRSYIWYYAPALGQVIRERYERFGKAPQVKQLETLTTRAPLARGPKFAEAMQASFENLLSGERASWRDEVTNQQGVIVIQRTLRRNDGTYCRDAELTIETRSAPVVQEMTACRGADGYWQVET